jgi:hypothetical protein
MVVSSHSCLITVNLYVKISSEILKDRCSRKCLGQAHTGMLADSPGPFQRSWGMSPAQMLPLHAIWNSRDVNTKWRTSAGATQAHNGCIPQHSKAAQTTCGKIVDQSFQAVHCNLQAIIARLTLQSLKSEIAVAILAWPQGDKSAILSHRDVGNLHLTLFGKLGLSNTQRKLSSPIEYFNPYWHGKCRNYW